MTVYRSGNKGYSDPLTTNGDVLIQSGGSDSRLSVGSEGQLLGITGGAPVWETVSSGSGGYTYPATTRANIQSLSTPSAGDTVYCSDLNKRFTYTGNSWQVIGETIEVISASTVSFSYTEVVAYTTGAYFINKTTVVNSKFVAGVMVFDAGPTSEYATVATSGLWHVKASETIPIDYFVLTSSTSGQARTSATLATGMFGVCLTAGSTGTPAFCKLYKPELF